MKNIILRFLVLSIFSFSAHAAPVFKVTKDGKTNWLVGTLHDLRPLVTEIPGGLAKIIADSRIVLTEAGGKSEAVQSALMMRRVSSRPVLRDPATSFSFDEYGRFLDFLRTSEITDHAFRSLHGMALYTSLSRLFSIAEQQILNEKVLISRHAFERDRIYKRLKELLNERKVSLNYQYSGITNGFENQGASPRGFLDTTLVEIAESRRIPVVALDSRDRVEPILGEKFEGAELGEFVRVSLARLEAIHAMRMDDSLALLVEYTSGLGVNSWKRYCRWTPEARFNFGPPATQGLRVQPVPTLLKRLLDRHDHWLQAIEREFAIGNAVVVVGAGHVMDQLNPGGKTLMHQLESQGYQIEHFPTESCD